MDEKKLFAIWQDNTTKGYIALTESQRDAINGLPNAGLYIGHDRLTNPEMYTIEPERTVCPECGGKGFVGGDGFTEDTETCQTCGGNYCKECAEAGECPDCGAQVI